MAQRASTTGWPTQGVRSEVSGDMRGGWLGQWRACEKLHSLRPPCLKLGGLLLRDLLLLIARPVCVNWLVGTVFVAQQRSKCAAGQERG